MHGASSTKVKVLRLRLKDKHAKFLRDLAGEVNFRLELLQRIADHGV
jgi:hypothetical protein